MRISLLFSLFFLIASNVFSQKIIKNGVVDFAVSVANLEKDQVQIVDSLFVLAKLSYTHYFSSNSFLLDNMDRDSSVRIRHHRSQNGQGSYFFNLKDQNYKIDELSEMTYKGIRTVDRLDVKKIAGYNCFKEKYFISDDNFIELYVTKNIKPGFNYYKQIFPNTKGFPLEIIIRKSTQVYKYTAKSINELPNNYPLFPDLQQYKLLKEGKLKAHLLALLGA